MFGDDLHDAERTHNHEADLIRQIEEKIERIEKLEKALMTLFYRHPDQAPLTDAEYAMIREVMGMTQASGEPPAAADEADPGEEDLSDVTIDGCTGHLMTVEDFKANCKAGGLIDSDGFGDFVQNGKIVTPSDAEYGSFWAKPSRINATPEGVTHILWYNK